MASIRARKDNGMLFIDFRYQDKRYREQTALGDTAANRKRLQKVLDRIEADIAAGTFDYRRFFPGSKNAAKFDPAPGGMVGPVSAAAVALPSAAASVASTPLFKDFAETWYGEKEVEWRRSYKTTLRATLDRASSRGSGRRRSARSPRRTSLPIAPSSGKRPRKASKPNCLRQGSTRC